MASTGVVCLLLLWIIESGIFRCLAKISIFPVSKYAPNRDLDLDSDVQEEENRLSL